MEKKLAWTESRLIINFSQNLTPGADLSPAGRFNVERDLQDTFLALMYNVLLDIPVDSYNSLELYLKTDKNLYKNLNATITAGRKEYSVFNREKNQVNLQYSFPLYGSSGLISGFIHHTVASPLPIRLGFVPTRPYSGIIIYALGEYPVFGKTEKTRLVPLFFPDFYDQNMNRFFEKSQCDPAFLAKWGMVAYTTGFDETKYHDRIGKSPLRLSLRGLFGKTPADLILPTEAVDKILAQAANRQLLKEGRILIICRLAD